MWYQNEELKYYVYLSLTVFLNAAAPLHLWINFTALTACNCNIDSLYHASVERGRESQQRRITTWHHHLASPPPPLPGVLAYPWKLHACKANNNCFLYLFLQNNIFLYNYLRQMYQIIHLSVERCLSPARVKACKKIVRIKEQVATWFVCSIHTRTHIPTRWRQFTDI